PYTAEDLVVKPLSFVCPACLQGMKHGFLRKIKRCRILRMTFAGPLNEAHQILAKNVVPGSLIQGLGHVMKMVPDCRVNAERPISFSQDQMPSFKRSQRVAHAIGIQARQWTC